MTAMNEEARLAAVATLLHLADGVDYRDRADAGRALASFADVPQAQPALHRLLLDAADTFVTHATADALLRRKDTIGLATVARALADADTNHADWIHTAVHDVFTIYARERDNAVRTCAVLTEQADQQLRQGTQRLREELTAINPIFLHP